MGRRSFSFPLKKKNKHTYKSHWEENRKSLSSAIFELRYQSHTSDTSAPLKLLDVSVGSLTTDRTSGKSKRLKSK